MSEGYLHISRETEAGDGSDLVEEGGDGVLAGLEGKVANEESIALGAGNVAVTLSAVVGAGTTVLSGSGLSGEVETHVTALKESTVLVGMGLLGSRRGREVDVSESARAAGLLVSDDTSANDLGVGLELLEEDVVIDAPSEVANPEGGALVGLLGLVLLAGLLNLLGGLSLLGRDLNLGLLLGLGLLGLLLRVGVGIAGIGLEIC